ncbi:MAG: LytR C-terminal domain-containing protein [Pseudolysinimonas sp.]
MATKPRDRFDDVPDDLVRVGAHRAPAKGGRGWINFAWAALATGVLIVGGLYGLSRVNPDVSFDLPNFGGGPTADATETPPPVVTPITDPKLVDPVLNLSISVLNGSPTDKQAEAAANQIALAGWPAPAAANSASRTEDVTKIYYNSSDFEGIALGLAQLLGTDPANIVLSDFFPGAPVTIILGADYVPPAS